MKLIFILVLLGGLNTYAATPSDCLGGDFAVCKEIFNKYGSAQDKTGAIELFTSACNSQNLHVVCQITSSEKSDTLKKTFDLAKPNMSIFVINGKYIDKIYQISQSK